MTLTKVHFNGGDLRKYLRSSDNKQKDSLKHRFKDFNSKSNA